MSVSSYERGRKYDYFQPNQIAVRVLHGGNALTQEQRSALIGWITLFAERSGAKIDPQESAVRTYSFAAKGDASAFSLVFVNLSPTSPQQLVTLVDLLQNNRQALGGGASVDQVGLNWFGAGAQLVGDGGPGGKPTRYHGIVTAASYEFAQQDAITKLLQTGSAADRGRGATVAILDTSPKREIWENVIYPKWHAQGHPLITKLHDSNPPLVIHDMPKSTIARLQYEADHDYHMEKHNYTMTSHGLFVAGIIRTIAPAAELHLIEALNPHGVCDGESIAEGMKVAGALGAKTLLVNCSLYFVPPLEDGHFHDDFLDVLPREWKIDYYGWVREKLKQFERVFSDIPPEGAVIAAAGNDAPSNTKRPSARIPAAFDSVQGVGALPKGPPSPGIPPHATASYSNNADNPTAAGILAFGGEEGGYKTGMLGVYIDDFPDDGLPSDTGWAWWCGTSFAAPIVTGTLAALLSVKGWSVGATVKFLTSSSAVGGAGLDQKAGTAELVLEVTQG